MPSLLLKDVEGSGGSGGSYFVPESVVRSPINSGNTGTFLSLPEVEGKVYKIKYLITASSGSQAGISLIVDGVTIVDELVLYSFSLAGPGSSGSFYIGVAYSGGIERVNQRIDPFYCKSLSILKNAGNTTRPLEFIYEVGSFKNEN